MASETPRQRPLRVIQWGTGNAGRKALAGILRHPELELAGVHAHSPAITRQLPALRTKSRSKLFDGWRARTSRA